MRVGKAGDLVYPRRREPRRGRQGADRDPLRAGRGRLVQVRCDLGEVADDLLDRADFLVVLRFAGTDGTDKIACVLASISTPLRETGGPSAGCRARSFSTEKRSLHSQIASITRSVIPDVLHSCRA